MVTGGHDGACGGDGVGDAGGDTVGGTAGDADGAGAGVVVEAVDCAGRHLNAQFVRASDGVAVR